MAIFITVFSLTWTPSKAQWHEEIEINPFWRSLGVLKTEVQLARDSQRIDLFERMYIILILRDKKPWNVRIYDKDNKEIYTGDFSEGNGELIVPNGSSYTKSHFQHGLLQDSLIVYSYQGSKVHPYHAYVYKDGIIQQSISTSYYAKNINQISYYEDGIIQRTESYGIRRIKWHWGLLLFSGDFFKIVKADQKCGETIYTGKRRIPERTCITRKCRNCGL